MKRIFLIFMVFATFFLFDTKVNAINTYNQVKVKTSFEESINLNNIEEIEIHLEDATEYSKDYILEKNNNFELTISDVPYGPYHFVYGVVIGDKIGYYNVSAEVNNTDGDSSLEVLVNVTTNKSTTTNKTLTDESINRIVGTEVQTTVSTTKTENDNAGIIIDDETDHDNSGLIVEEDETTTTVSKDIEEARKKEAQEEKKLATRKRNSLIGKIMFSIIGITLLIGIIYASVKIHNANK